MENINEKHILLRAEIEALRSENQRLSDQVKRLVRAESSLYEFQEQIDRQLTIYRRLYENGKQLNTTLELNKVFQIATQFILYDLNFERCLILMADQTGSQFRVQAWDGYYDDRDRQVLQNSRFSLEEPPLNQLTLGETETIVCSHACDDPILLQFGRSLALDEYAVFPLGKDVHAPTGLLIIGNTREMVAYQTAIQANDEWILGLANLASQLSTAMNNIASYQALQKERSNLEEKVKQLVKTESQLYTVQQELDDQLRIYRQLYEIGKQLNSTVEVAKILGIVTQFVLYELNFERCLVFLQNEADIFGLVTFDGYYDDESAEAINALQFSDQEPIGQRLLSSLDSTMCSSSCCDPSLEMLKAMFKLEEYVVFPLGASAKTPLGFVVVGNTAENAAYQTPIEADNIAMLGLANLVSQTSTAIENARSYQALEQEQHLLEAKVEERTREIHRKNLDLQEILAELQQTQSQLIQSEKMSSLGNLVAGVAHEINNPVSFIYGNLIHAQEYVEGILALLKLYQEHCPDPSPVIRKMAGDIDIHFVLKDLPKSFASMKLGAERIREIVRSLRTFSRMDESEVKAVNIHDGLDSTLMILGHRLKEQSHRPAIQVEKDYGELPAVECYAGQLNQVFMNLLGNAVDALEEAIANRQCTVPKIRIQTRRLEKDWAIIRIVDNGPGISQEVQQRLFDPFFTTKPVGQGTGLGLAISYQIITERHQGSLECFSELGIGTEFAIAIPLHRTAL